MNTRPKRSTKASPETDEAVYNAISEAILEGRLKAGTKLAEHRLAAIFNVSRERIRKVLHRLGAERRIEMAPNRGGRVAQPSIGEIRAVYEAHRILEAGVLQQLARTVTPETMTRIDAHLATEQAAAEAGDRATSVRLSGAFHLLLVDALGNEELSRFLRELLSRSSVMVSVYEAASQSICGVDEHRAIAEALRAGDAARAVAASQHHFRHVEERLRPGLEGAANGAEALEEAFAQRA